MPLNYTPHDDPTPEEIKAGCEKAQERWSPAERRRRAGLDKTDEPWSAPLVRVFGDWDGGALRFDHDT